MNAGIDPMALAVELLRVGAVVFFLCPQSASHYLRAAS